MKRCVCQVLERRLAALGAQGKARTAQASGLAAELEKLEAASGAAQAGRDRSARLEATVRRLAELQATKADRADVAAVGARVGALEATREREAAAGLSMDQVATGALFSHRKQRQERFSHGLQAKGGATSEGEGLQMGG